LKLGNLQGKAAALHDIIGFELALVRDGLAVYKGRAALSAHQITYRPFALADHDLGMVPAQRGIMKHNVSAVMPADSQPGVGFPLKSLQAGTETGKDDSRTGHVSPAQLTGVLGIGR
jgi:hypothetical protein